LPSRDGCHESSPGPAATITAHRPILYTPTYSCSLYYPYPYPYPYLYLRLLLHEAATAMHAYSRPSPRTASPANNLQTNPTRTNNQRYPPHDPSPYSSPPPHSDRGVEDSEGEMMSRGEHLTETDQKHYHKVNQVIQVEPSR